MTIDSRDRKINSIVEQITSIGLRRHSAAILEHARANVLNVKKSIRDVKRFGNLTGKAAIIVSAGPSVRRKNSIARIAAAKFDGTIIAVDGSYVACLRQGLIPDYVVTLDPHPVRMVRWFGDPAFELNSSKDDYFARQDLDLEFRKNSLRQNEENIALVNRYGHMTKAIVAATAPPNVVARLQEVGMELYWWNPLVDDPKDEHGLTRALFRINRLPSLNTGGNVGTASWVFAAVTLATPSVALVGMDLGYYADTPREATQTYYELIAHLGGEEGLEECFLDFTFPLNGESFYTDPTYYWYRRNFLDLVKRSPTRTFNCTEGGILFGEGVTCSTLDEYLTGAR